MKKVLLLVLSCLMLVTASCGGSAPEESLSPTESESMTEAATPEDTDPVANDASLASLKVDGIPVFAFSPERTSYSASARKVNSIAVDAVPTQEGATVRVEQEGSTAKVIVTSQNGKNERVYTVRAYERVTSKIVNKNGANAIVTYVIDDGDKSTATFVTEKMAAKYPSLTASFALVTGKLATFETVEGADGMLEYAKDEDGNYIYTKNQSEWSFWDTLLKKYGKDGFEAVSHSHTHKYWGESDEGGAFEYKLSDGRTMVSEEFPKGNVSKEFFGSNQILRELSQRALVFVRTGLSVDGSMIKYSDTFWKNMEESGAFIGARGTYTYPNKPDTMINRFTAFNKESERFFLKSYMVQHYNTSSKVKTAKGTSTPEECLAAGIDYWTTYIDTAVENNAWAAFCIHTIRPDNHKGNGHYIFESQADELFAYTEKLSAENKVWVANLTDAFIYAIERSTSTVDAYLDNDGNISVSLTCKESGDIYDEPLTVRIRLPEGKSGASFGGEALTTVTEKNDVYVYVDMIPGTKILLEVK